MMRTAISAVEGVAGGGTEAGHGWKLADGPDSRQDPCAPPTNDGSGTGICPDHPQFITDRQTGAVPHEGATTMTTHRRLHALALALGLCLATAASAQTVGYNIRTGDVWVDNRLGEITDYGRYHRDPFIRSEEHKSELQSLMRSSYAVYWLKKKQNY